jgi:CSLREA domain-containing protein
VKRRAAFAFVITVTATLLVGDGARAATFVVTKTLDTSDGNCDADCSLREAVLASFASPGSTILVPSGVFTLTHPDGDLDVFNATIDGSGSTIVQGGPGWTDRIFDVGSGPTVLRDLTVRGGNVVPFGAFTDNGGGIRVQQIISTVTLERVRIEDNFAADNGGGLWLDTQTVVTLIDSDVVGNTAGTNGGGIGINGGQLNTQDWTTITDNVGTNTAGGIFNQGTMVLNQTIVANNITPAAGAGIVNQSGTDSAAYEVIVANNEAAGIGGIWNVSGNFEIYNSAITGHTTVGGGGAVSVNSGTVRLYLSAITDNHTGSAGAGIIQTGGTLYVRDSTLSGNTSDGDGGGFYSTAGTANISRTTIANNTADADANNAGDGGGLARVGAGTVNVLSSILGDNLDLSATTIVPECSGTIVSQGTNVIESTAGCTGTVGSYEIADAMLGPLTNNGGVTLTHAIPSISPAVDNVPANDGDCVGIDQRGVPRPVGPGCDSGGYEHAACLGVTVNVVGTDGDDVITGTSGNDAILALAGNDTVNALSGNDKVCGGAGNDVLSGGDGDDHLDGNVGKDQLFGDAGMDQLDGGKGRRDKCFGGTETDTFVSCETKRQQG